MSSHEAGWDLVEGRKTHIDDLALVCANCHRIIHRGKPWLSVAELKALMNEARLKSKSFRPRMASVRIMSPPREIKGYNYDMIWHTRLNVDPAHRWFREHVRILGKFMSKIPFLLVRAEAAGDQLQASRLLIEPS